MTLRPRLPAFALPAFALPAFALPASPPRAVASVASLTLESATRFKPADGGGRSRWAGAAAGLLGAGFLLTPVAQAAQAIPRASAPPAAQPLPVRSVDAARLAGDFGQFNVTRPSTTELRVEQGSLRAIVNWDSFNVATGHQVQFVQPAQGSTLNRIWDANPSVVQGRIRANGEVLLENANGVIFGATARVETGRFVATALRVQDAAFYRAGLAFPPLGDTREPAFAAGDSERQGYVSVERGAEIRTAAGGTVLLLGPRVVNAGRIEVPDGQAVLAAGRLVYVAASLDPAQRGLVVGVNAFSGNDPDLNRVTQDVAGSYRVDAQGNTVVDSTAGIAAMAGMADRINAIVAERGSINLVALSIHQNGVLQASTAVRGRNGVIELLAQAQVNPAGVRTAAAQDSLNNAEPLPRATALGEVVFGAASRTEILPEADAAGGQFASEVFNASRLLVEAARVWLRGGAELRAPAGRIEIVASQTPAESRAFEPTGSVGLSANDSSRIVVESGAVIDAAGLRNVTLPMSRNQLNLRLFQNELADAPLQRDGVLYREEIFFDARQPPTLANVAGAYATIARGAEELSTPGGSVSLRADGAVAIDTGAVIDVSGGSLRFEDGQIRSSLLRQGDRWVPVAQARADTRYDELGNSLARTAAGTQRVQVSAVPGYVEGRNAGALEIYARRAHVDGALRGDVVVGPQQLQGAGSAAPIGARLDIGSRWAPDRSAYSGVVIAPVAAARPTALYANPLLADIDAALAPTLVLAAPLLALGGFGDLRLTAMDIVRLDSAATLQLPAFGALSMVGSQVQVDGRLHAAAGRFSASNALEGAAANAGIRLGAGSLLDLSGRWIDSSDTAVVRALDGGSVLLASRGTVQTALGAAIDVSAGALRSAGALTTTGRAGNIEVRLNEGLNLTQAAPVPLGNWQARIAGFDFDAGGRLAFSGLASLTLGGNAASPGFDSNFFNANGFGNISLAALGDVRLASNLNLALGLRNLLAGTAADGSGRFVSTGVQPLTARRRAVTLTLAATAPVDRINRLPGASLVMDTGARITTGAGGSLRLNAQRQLTVGGTLTAPAGEIALTLDGRRGGNDSGGVFEDTVGYLDTQSVWLSSSALLDVSGVVLADADVLGRPRGRVLGGGTISLLARRGHVVTDAGAVLTLRGASGTVWTDGARAAQALSADGGTLRLQSAEGMHLAARVDARAADARGAGGQLQLRLGLSGTERFTSGPAYATSNRELRLQRADPSAIGLLPGATGLAAAVGSGTTVGTTVIGDRLLRDAGFATLSLQADDALRFGTGMTLSASRALLLDAPVLGALGDAEVALRAPHVALGNQRRVAPSSHERIGNVATGPKRLPVAMGGDGVLTVLASLIEVHGDTATQGLRFMGLDATLGADGTRSRTDGEIRLIAVAQGVGNTARSQLAFAGELQFTAGVTHTTTMSDYSVVGTTTQLASVGAASGGAAPRELPAVLAVFGPAGGSASLPPPSAAGRLTMRADLMRLAGNLHQPFGAIDAQADTLIVADSARISVSGAGQSLLLGSTVNGRQWQYRPTGLYQADGSARSVDPALNADIRVLDALPVDNALRLDGRRLEVNPAALLDARGGGDLLAWEFVPGVGGTRDVLANPGVFAVLPGYSYGFAPVDAEIVGSGAAASLRPGSRVEIVDAGSALPPGTYTLLPARYALLPGAVVVSLQAGAAPAQARAGDNGSVVVAARLGSGAAPAPGAALQAVKVEAAAVALRASRIDLTPLDRLLGDRALRLDEPVPALPADAGRITLLATEPLRLAADLRLQAPSGRRAGTLEIGVRDGRIVVLDLEDSDTLPPDGISRLDAGSLVAAGADRLVLGGAGVGSEASGAGDMSEATGRVQALSRQVQVQATAQPLQAGRVLLLAREEVDLLSGARVRSATVPGPGAGAGRIELDGAAALLYVGPDAGAQVLRTGDGAGGAGSNGIESAGRVNVAAGAGLQGATVLLDAERVQLDPGTALQPQHFSVRARTLALGAVTAAEGDSVLAPALLDGLDGIASLSFGASERLDLYGTRNVRATRISLDTPVLRGVGTAADVSRFEADDIDLRNTGAAPAPLVAAAGEVRAGLALVADRRITLGVAGGAATVLDFARVALQAGTDIRLDAAGGLQAPGLLNLQAPRIGASTGSQHTLQAERLTLGAAASTSAATLPAAGGTGASLRLRGNTVEHDGRLELPGGTIRVEAGSGGLRLGTGAVTSVAGALLPSAGGAQVAGPGGLLSVESVGDIVLDGRLDVSGARTAAVGGTAGTDGHDAADAGRVELLTGGTLVLGAGLALQGSAAPPRLGGRFDAQVSGLLDGTGRNAGNGALDTLAQGLDEGGFDGAIALRLRQGDLRLATSRLRAAEVVLSADNGRIDIDAPIVARRLGGIGGIGGVSGNSGVSGGRVELHAGTDLRVTGPIDANGGGTGGTADGMTDNRSGSGGQITLGSARGRVQIGAGALLETGMASGDGNVGDGNVSGGRIVLRARRDDSAGTVAVDIEPGTTTAAERLRAGQTVVEAVRVYEGVSRIVSGPGTPGATDGTLGQDNLRADASAFAGQADALLQGLGLGGRTDGTNPAVLEVSAEVRSSGRLELVDDFNLHSDGVAQPLTLSLRAAGELKLSGSLGDGFASVARPAAVGLTAPTGMFAGPAASLRLVAGADLGAAHPLAVRTRVEAPVDLVLADDTVVRTTSGNIDMAAARDIVMWSGQANRPQAVVMVTGRPTAQTLNLLESQWQPQFTTDGGGLRLSAGRDIIGAPATQLYGAWFYKVASFELPLAWFSAFDAFRMGVGSFGGGAVQVIAGRDIRQLSVVAPTQGLASAGPDDTGLRPMPTVQGGGDIHLRADGDIAGGNLLLGRGSGRIEAGGNIVSAPGLRTSVPTLGLVIGLMDGQVEVVAGGDITLASVFNPTLLPSANTSQQPRISSGEMAQFVSYGADAGVQLRSQAGDIQWQAEQPSAPLASAWFSQLAINGPEPERQLWNAQSLAPARALPPRLGLAALGGDIVATLPAQGLTLSPSTQAALWLHAGGDLLWQASEGSGGGGPALAVSDRQVQTWPTVQRPIEGPVQREDGDRFAAPRSLQAPVWDGLHGQSTGQVRLYAGQRLDFSDARSGQLTTLLSPLPVRIESGGELEDLNLVVQHSRDTQLSQAVSGGSLLQTQTGTRITLAGPGALVLTATRQIDLGSSAGIETVGNLFNPRLPAAGASIRLQAGAGDDVDAGHFVARWLQPWPGDAAAQTGAFVDGYLQTTGRDAAETDAAGEDDTPRSRRWADRRPLGELLADRAGLRRQLQGADAAVLAARQAGFVDAVRAAQLLPPLEGQPLQGPALLSALTDSVQAYAGLPAAQQAAIADRLLDTAFYDAYLAPGRPHAAAWQALAASAGVDPAQRNGPLYESVRDEIVFSELARGGNLAAPVSASRRDLRAEAFDIGFLAAELAGWGPSRRGSGDIDLVDSGVQALRGGDITLLAPGGQIIVGLPGVPQAASSVKIRGVVGYGASNISAYADADFQVNTQRVFVVGQGDITLWSSRGDIDAGRGANTAVNVPPVVPRRQADGSVSFELPAVTTGSGIGVLRPPMGQAQGSIGLYAPNGEVLALDAQIRAPGRVTAAADQVRGADNIAAGSVAGVPVVVPAPAVALPQEPSAAGAAQAGTRAAASNAAPQRSSLLLLELLGLGPAPPVECLPDEDAAECERRRR